MNKTKKFYNNIEVMQVEFESIKKFTKLAYEMYCEYAIVGDLIIIEH